MMWGTHQQKILKLQVGVGLKASGFRITKWVSRIEIFPLVCHSRFGHIDKREENVFVMIGYLRQSQPPGGHQLSTLVWDPAKMSALGCR